MAVALESIVKELTDSGVIAQGQLENFIPPKAHPQSVEELIAQLVKEKHLTKFQAAQVAAGKAKALILGEYTILYRIGAGGMGQVFKALHRRMERTVAIKMLPSAMTKDALALARFQREVIAAAKLHHTNIVTAYDAGQAGPAHFLVMEYVDGKDLSALVKDKGPLPVNRAINYTLQAARGLEYAHTKGVVHRDIKPANLLLDSEGTVKILDMGLARIESPGSAQAELTGTGAVMGTVDYMSPEQAFNTKHADARADIYSLGCSLYYLISGKAIYGGETVVEKLFAHKEKEIPSLRAENAQISEQLESIFKKMVAKQIEDRYQMMTEVIADLERLSGNSGTFSDPYGATTALDKDAVAAFKGIAVTPTTANKGTTKKITTVKSDSGKQPPWKNIKVLVGAAILGVLVLAGIVISLKTKDGRLIVEIDQPDATVQVLDAEGKIEISQKGGNGKVTISVDPGRHWLKVQKDGFTVFGQEFEMEKGGKKEIAAKLEPVKSTVVAMRQPNAPWNKPAFQQWMKEVQALPAAKQGEAVLNKLVELNPGLEFRYTPTFSQSNGRITECELKGTDSLTDISPLRALTELKTVQLSQSLHVTDLSPLSDLALTTLNIWYTKATDLSPLKGMPLETLHLPSGVSDLSPLEGMPLKTLTIFSPRFTDLSPLRGIALDRLEFDLGQISDLSPLAGMPLTILKCTRSPIKDLSPLKDCKSLLSLDVTGTKVTPAAVAALQEALPNCEVKWDDPAK